MAGLSVLRDRPIRQFNDEPPIQVRGFCLRFGSSLVSPRGLRGSWRLGVAAVVCTHPRLDCVSSPAFGSICLLSLRHDEISTLGSVRTYITINHASFHAPYFLARFLSHAPFLRYPQLERRLSRAHLKHESPRPISITLTHTRLGDTLVHLYIPATCQASYP